MSILLFSCSTFPTEQLSFDVSQSKIPVMLTKVAGDSVIKEFNFEAGYSHASITSQNRTYGGGSATTTLSASADTSKPIKQQLGNFFIQDPAWAYVNGLSISDDHSVFNFLVVGIDKYDYDTALRLDVAGIGGSK